MVLPVSFVWLSGENIEVPKGTHFKVGLSQEISTKTAKRGEPFQAALVDNCVLEDRIIIPKGSILHGAIVRASRAGRLRGRAELAFYFHQVELPSGDTFEISASPVATEGTAVSISDEGVAAGKKSGKRTAVIVAGATATGASVGAAVGRKKGAAVGASIGIIAGIIGSAATGSRDQVLEKGTVLELVLDRPASVPVRAVKR
ncbi:MAG: hypothetical protein HY644_15700 [Acidobacteria bacterium]|nr:hypothetical protein [Acidobacteriota bacterium]